jgi:redox-sensing transcriptional repressor
MIAAGIRGIWNYMPVKLQVSGDVVTQKEDLAEGLAMLSHRMHHVSRSAPIFNPAAAADRRPKA